MMNLTRYHPFGEIDNLFKGFLVRPMGLEADDELHIKMEVVENGPFNYYDKIPEESPFYRQARKKLNTIASIKEKWKVVAGDTVEISKVVIIENTYKVDNVSRLPIHTVTIANNTRKTLESVIIEFIYYDEAGSVVTTLVGNVKASVEPKSQNVFDNISPGTLQERFVNCEARIINAHFQ